LISDRLCRVDAGTQALAADFAELGAGPCGWHVQECGICSGGCFPPRLRCPHCGSAELQWAPVGKSAALVSVVFVHGENPRHKPPRALRRPEGYATGIVALDGWPDVRFPVLIEGEDAAIAKVGMRVDIGSALIGSRTVPCARLRHADRSSR
jgi:uncharacterized OB-fold protein